MRTKKITQMGLFLATALVLSYLESLLPVVIAVPGVKIGLANIITMLLLYQYGGRRAFLFMVVRVVLSGFLFSGMAGIVYSLAGGICCIVVMELIRKIPYCSILGVSMAGAVSHNFGQILVAWLVMANSHILYYFPVLCISGLITGILIGLLSDILWKRLKNIL
ncbi:MAG: Gx transporter family protein [Lachnospiraceae bacterium]|nr:Gx transporter family protein [Lachnospiraceae bacterium]HCJ06838.1 heptaprenyl diphosphate synthase [Lachnospiraceae bacterium]